MMDDGTRMAIFFLMKNCMLGFYPKYVGGFRDENLEFETKMGKIMKKPSKQANY